MITDEGAASAMRLASSESTRIEEALIELDLVNEPDLLRALASFYKTQFISTEKLSKANIDKKVLAMIPKAVAVAHAIFPLAFDQKTATLTVATADPDDAPTLREVQGVSGAQKVHPIFARPRAVHAAVARVHQGDLQAFARLLLAGQVQLHGMRTIRSRSDVPPPMVAAAAVVPAPAPSAPRPRPSQRALAAIVPQAPVPKVAVYAPDEVNEVYNVLVNLIENGRPDLRGHSAHVARLMRRVAERMALPAATIHAVTAAGFLHDLGKMGSFHLTAFNCAEHEGHRLAAQKSLRTPARLLESVKVAPETTEAIVHMYERHDGLGFPDALALKGIPFGARILSIVDTYADLTQNPRNPYGRTLNPLEAFAVLDAKKASLFDPDLVDVFRSVVMGEDLKARLLEGRRTVLLVDPDPEETTVLELRLIEQGFEVKIARGAEPALQILPGGEIDVVVSEVDLPGVDGLDLLAQVRREKWGKDVAWVFHTRRQGRAEAQRAFDLGVADFVAKPTATDILVAKLGALLDSKKKAQGTAGGVSGSLSEMGLPDMVQVLFHGRKSGNLKITSGGLVGEIHFVKGAVVNALWQSLVGADAFYRLLALSEGDFQLDPSFRAQETRITEAVETLLLEGMRRLDEGL